MDYEDALALLLYQNFGFYVVFLVLSSYLLRVNANIEKMGLSNSCLLIKVFGSHQS
jgi:hypothetical protein